MSRPEALLLETARRGQLHHAVILHGPVAEALRDLAFGIARALTCTNGTTGDDCASCQKIARGTHPDVHHVAVQEDRKLIAVEQIRQIVSEATLRPYEGRAKVFIIDPADAVSAAGANAMLKTLEEPTGSTSFILLARSADLLLPTIRSRSQAIPVHPSWNESPREESARERVSLQLARLRRQAVALPSTGAPEAEAAVREVLAAVGDYSSRRDLAALLAAAASITGRLDPAAALPLIALTLRDLAALPPDQAIDPRLTRSIRETLGAPALLRAAEIAIRNATRLTVNADPKLLAEQALLELARP